MNTVGIDITDCRYLVVSGGVGGAKLALGLYLELSGEELLVVGNVGDDFRHWGLHISPDLDTLMYTLAGVADPDRGWGRAEESWTVLETLSDLGGIDWFRLGDRDLAIHLERTVRINDGEALSTVTRRLCQAFGVTATLVPPTDSAVRTMVETTDRTLSFQEYFVRERCEPTVTRLQYQGASQATLLPELGELLIRPELTAVILTPSNPYLSLDPILEVADLRQRLATSSAPVVAVSPLIQSRAFKGPTAKIMLELGFEVSTLTIAQHYSDVLDGIVIDSADHELSKAIENLGIKVWITDTDMANEQAKRRLAAEVISFSETIARK